jgi:predicted chitinase
MLMILVLSATAQAASRPVAANRIERPVTNSGAQGIVRLFNAIREVETGTHPDPANARGDGGRSLGPYQITVAYWKDSGVPGRYDQVRNRAYAERVMIAYWQRFCPEALAKGDWRTLAKVHNGGPNGPAVPKTIVYWLKVRQALAR